MSWFLTRGGYNPKNSAAFAILSTSTGTWELSLSNGQKRVVSISDASNSTGIVWVEFLNLYTGTEYELNVTDGIRNETVKFKTANDNHNTVIGSCWQTYSWFEPVSAEICKLNPTQILNAGDGPYCDNNRQVTNANGGVDLQMTALRTEYFKFLGHSSRQPMLLNSPHMHVDSDHDYAPGNDYPGRDDVGAFPGEKELNYWYYVNSSLYPKAVTAIGTDGSNYARDLIDQGKLVFRNFTRNPPNPDIGHSYGGGVVPDDAIYTRWTIGRVEYFMLTQTWYADCVTQAAGITNRSMLGSVQLAWFLDRIKKSTSVFKVILFPQMLLTAEPINTIGRNNYARACYSDEGAVIKETLTNFSDWAVPGGAIVFSGDTHTPTIIKLELGESIWQITPCPSGTDGVPAPSDNNTAAGEKLRFFKVYSGTKPPNRYFGLVEDIGAGNLLISLLNSFGGVEWRGELPVGQNDIVYSGVKLV